MRISWLDVFTDRPLGGNPLAVVHDADGLDAEQMQVLAGEIGLSETIFVLDDATALRIFTPEIEMPLAGHPVVGASVDLARLGRIPSEGAHVFRTGRGETPVELSDGTATMTQAPPEIGPDLDPGEIAPLLGLAARDLVSAPGTANTAVRFVLAEVAGRDVLASVSADQAAIGSIEDPALGLVAWCELGEGEVAQRMFGPRMGIPEDPATGAAAGALAALRVARGAEPGPVVIHQGSEIGRPSVIHAEAGGAPGAPADIRVGGTAVLIFEGEIAPGVPR